MRLNRRAFLSHWVGLGAVFAFLSADEVVGIHESISAILRRLGHFTGYARFPWVIPAVIALGLFGPEGLRLNFSRG